MSYNIYSDKHVIYHIYKIIHRDFSDSLNVTVTSKQNIEGLRMRVADAGGNVIAEPIKTGWVRACIVDRLS